MENAFELSSASSNDVIRVEVINTDDFREDLAHKVIAAVAVATAVGGAKFVWKLIDSHWDKRQAKKAEEEPKKPELKTVKKS